MSIDKICIQCGKSFTVIPYRINAKFCSLSCSAKSVKGCRRANSKGWFINNKGYKIIYKPGHPTADKRGYIMEHRFIMEKNIGRFLDKKEIVHHKNGNPMDNHIENLELCAGIAQHMLHHRRKYVNEKECTACLKILPLTDFYTHKHLFLTIPRVFPFSQCKLCTQAKRKEAKRLIKIKSCSTN